MCSASATGFVHNGTAAFQQVGGTLIVSASDFRAKGEQTTIHKPQKQLAPAGLLNFTTPSPSPWVHVKLFPNAQKTIITANIVAGELNIEKALGYVGKVAVSDNLDDRETHD